MRDRCSGIDGSVRVLCAIFLALAALWVAPINAGAAIVFDGSPGTAAPPATLGPYTMTPFPDDTRSTGVIVTTVPSPAPVAGTITLNPGIQHDAIGSGWATWSHGYTGDVYDAWGITDTVTLTLPSGTGAFYLYAEPNLGGLHNITAAGTGPSGSISSGPIPVEGTAGARYFGFFTTLPGEEIQTIVISSALDADEFAIGEFGIAPTMAAIRNTMYCRSHSVAGNPSPDSVVYAGEQWLCDVTIFNDGPAVEALTLADTIPAGLTFAASTVAEADSGGAAAACTPAPAVGPATVTCTGIDVPAGGMVTFQLGFEVAPDYVVTTAEGEAPVTNRACITFPPLFPDNACAQETDLVKELAELRISKYAQPISPIYAGDLFEYTIWVDNYGPSVARDVVIRDTLLTGVTPPANDGVLIQSCAFSVSQGGGAIVQFTCTTGELVGTQFGTDVGTFRTNKLWPYIEDGDPLTDDRVSPGRLRASFRLQATVGAASINTTTVGSRTPDPDASNNMAEDSIEILPAADIAVTLSATGEEQQTSQPGRIFDTTTFGQAFPTAPNYFASTRVTAGRRIQYAMTVTNTATDPDYDPAQNVVLSARLPAGVRIYQGSLTAPAGVNCETGTPGEPLDRLTCGVGTLAPAASATITFQVVTDSSIAPGTVLGSDVVVSSDTYDRANGNNYANTQTTVTSWADTTVAISAVGEVVGAFDPTLGRFVTSDLPNEVTAGRELRYEIQVQNNGPADAANVQVMDLLPDLFGAAKQYAVTFLRAAGATCRPDDAHALWTIIWPSADASGQAVTCDLGTVAAGARRTFDLYVLVDPAVPGGTILDNGALVMFGPASPPAQPPALFPGFPSIPPTLPVTDDPFTDDNFAVDNTTVRVAVATEGVDLQAFSVFGAEIQTNGLPGLTIDTNLLPPMPDPACCNFGGTTVTAGRRIQWDTSALNAGPAPAHNAWIEVLLPFGTSLIENTLTGVPNPGNVAGRCGTEDAGELRKKVVCRYGTLLPSQIASLRFQVLVDPALPPGTQLSIDARAGADEADLNDSNNITGIQFDTDAWADQGVDIADIPLAQTWSPGDSNVFEVRVENRGPSLALASALLLDLPAEFVFDGATAMYAGLVSAGPQIPGGLPCQALSATQVLCPLGDLEVTTQLGYGAVPLRVFVSGRVREGTPAPTTLTATATVVGSTRDPFSASDSDSEQVDTDAAPPAGTADLAIGLFADPAPQFSPGQEVAYTVEVTNNGPANAANVVVVDELPAAIVPTGYDLGVIAGSCLVAEKITCTLGGIPTGESRSFTIRGYVKRRIASQARVSNAVSVASDTPDVVPENNYASVISVVKVRNVVVNPGFEDPVADPPWQELSTDPGDGQDCLVAHDGGCSYLLQGVAGVEKRLRQDMVFNGKKGDQIEVSAFSKAKNVSGSGSYRVELRAYLANGWRTFATQSFSPGTHGWQRRGLSFTAPWNFRALAVVVKFRKMSGTAWFDDVRVKVHPGSTP